MRPWSDLSGVSLRSWSISHRAYAATVSTVPSQAGGALPCRHVSGVLVAQRGDVARHLGIARVRLEELQDALARVREQHAVHEIHGRRRALDVEEDEACARAHARGAMCIGPRQTGS